MPEPGASSQAPVSLREHRSRWPLPSPAGLAILTSGSLAGWFMLAGTSEPDAPVFDALPAARVAAHSAFDRRGDLEGWRAVSGIGQLRVAQGRLDIRTSGPDPYVVGPPIFVETSAHQFLGLRCRTNTAGVTQIYFSDTEQLGFVDGRFVAIEMAPTAEFVTYEIDLRHVPSWSGTVDALRIDPVNGAGETAARFELDWIALYQAPPRLVPSIPYWDGPDDLVVGFENRGGWAIESPIEFVSEGVLLGVLRDLEPRALRQIALDASYWPRSSWIEAVHEGRRVWRGRLLRPREFPSRSHGGAHESSPSISIVDGVGLLRAGSGQHGSPIPEVRLSPVASVTSIGADGVPTYYEFDPTWHASIGAETKYRESLHDPLRGTTTCTVSVTGADVETTLESDRPLDVLRFEGPRLLQERPHSHALLPGLEYLEAGETSSDSSRTGTSHAAREHPPAYRITAPMIAIEYDRVAALPASHPDQTAWVAGLTWADRGADALVGATVPAVEFRSHGDSGSWASVFLPARRFTDPHEDHLAAQAERLPVGSRLSLRTTFTLERGTLEDVFARHWIPRTPTPPPLGFVTPGERAKDDPRLGAGAASALERILEISMEAYTRTLFCPSKRWKTHIAVGETPADRPEMAAAIVAEAARAGRPDYLDRVGLARDTSIEARLGAAGEWVGQKSRNKAVEAIAAMAPDGSIGYAVTHGMTELISTMTGQLGSPTGLLGDLGATNAGLIAAKALPLLEYAACTRDPAFVAAALRALSRLNDFTVPRGSQTWEIDAGTPDLYSSALCAQANLWGWRITGDERHIEEARRWIRTGLPFLYWWEPAARADVDSVHVANRDGEGPVLDERDPSPFYADLDRTILPFASIPVFGTSWYSVPWFGIPVQWCGLAWANVVREIDVVHPMPEYVRVADGIFRSAANQQCDGGYLAGTLPDSWDLGRNTSRQPFIVPERIVEYAYRSLGVPVVGSMEYVRLDGAPWTHVASRSILECVEQREGRVSIAARFFADQDASLLLGGAFADLASVRVDGLQLEPGSGVGQYHWIDCDEGRAVLVVRWRSSSIDSITIEIDARP